MRSRASSSFEVGAARNLAMEFGEIRVILTTVRAVCSVKPVELGLDLAERRRFSVNDALIFAAALRAGCTVLYTEDLHHDQKIGGLRIRNPFINS